MANHIFRRFAGSFQLRLHTFDDLLHMAEVPEAHWVATACPVQGLSCDPRFLACMDQDNNGRIRAEELREAVRWTGAMLADHSACVPGSDTLELARLAAAAAALHDAAALVLTNLGAADRERITLAQVRQTVDIMRRVSANGDGIIAPPGVEEPRLKQLLTDILASLPPVVDRSGDKGADRATVKAFADAHAATLTWLDGHAALKAWGPDTVAKATLARALAPRLDEYFMQCRLVATQPSAAERFQLKPERLEALLGDPVALRQALAALPVAAPDPRGVLTWAALHRGPDVEMLGRLRDEVCAPVLGASTTLSEADWRKLVAAATPVWEWSDAAAKHPLLKLGEDRLRAITAADLAALDELCVKDLQVNDTLAKVGELEKLILYQRWLFTFANNFVAMPDLYAATGKALFEQGRLIMSGREFKLSVLVTDRAAHAAMIAESSMFILYCRISGGKPAREYEVAVPVTSGTCRGLFVGKRGIFVGLDGAEYDALVTQIVVAPVSLVEALYMPFIRIGAFIKKRIEGWTKSSEESFDKELTARTDQAKVAIAAPPPAATPPPPPPPAKGKAAPAAAGGGNLGNMLMGGGIAFAAIGSTLAFVVSEISKLGPVQIVWGILALVGIMAVPSLIMAWLKIRSRNLAVLLEAGGWALNDRLRLTRELGLLFTLRPARPPGTKLELLDEVHRLISKNPVAAAELKRQKRQIWSAWITFVFVMLALTYLWSGLFTEHCRMAAKAVHWQWLEEKLEKKAEEPAKPEEAKPAEAKPGDAKPTDAKPAEGAPPASAPPASPEAPKP